MKSLQKIRKMFPIVQSKVFLNHAAMSPLPKPAIQAMQKFTKEFSETAAFEGDPNEPKKTFARLVGANKERLSRTLLPG